ncbi:hypothetical protein BALOs_1015 [Halobacteriovorax sp. BALOs_7]|uniref:hypothetical protein n=1 Tax=Halobacteriovorax TaxID=1652133 RepID=UPI000EB6CE4E|nr:MULTISPECIES: hypothetical protein [Halobacteriovorax]AYF44025.1 hypothetical protein BALOs_1015 [Halobacteriovorax sp. BALOs_7]
MENTTDVNTVEVKNFEYEGRTSNYKSSNEEGSDLGLYLILILFVAVFFAVILFQMYS